MSTIKKIRVKTLRSKLNKGDILTEMFEHFRIRVIDVTVKSPKPNNKKNV